MASSCQELIRAVIEPRPDALTPCLPIPKMKTLPKNQTPAVPQPRLLDLREEPAPEILWFLMPDASWDFFFFLPRCSWLERFLEILNYCFHSPCVWQRGSVTAWPRAATIPQLG